MNQRTKKQCSIDGCESLHYGRGWCRNHYSQWYRTGDPLIRQVYANPEDSFAARTEWQESCLVWTSTLSHDGYGLMSIPHGKITSHRYAWQRSNGEIPSGLVLDHLCHNRACCNIEHLRLITNQQNTWYRAGAKSDSKSGVRNVHKNGKGWAVTVTKDGEKHYFGMYPTIEEAALVAEEAREKLFGTFAGKG